MKKERRKLCLRLIIFTLLLGVSLTLLYLVGYNYITAAVWLPYSVLVTLTIIDLVIIMLIVTSITRYFLQKSNVCE